MVITAPDTCACRNVELHGLLDASTSFPAGEFGSDPSLLSALGQLGMQSGVTPAAVLEMARYVQSLAQTDRAVAPGRLASYVHLNVLSRRSLLLGTVSG